MEDGIKELEDGRRELEEGKQKLTDAEKEAKEEIANARKELDDAYVKIKDDGIGIPEEQFSMIFAVLSLIAGFALSIKSTIEKKYKNRTLSFLALNYIGACVIIGIISSIYTGTPIIPIILFMYVVQRMSTAIWYILEEKYIKNFTKEDERNKITFTYEFIGAIFASISSIIGGLLLNVFSVQNAFLIVGLVSLALMIVTLDYMRTRFGLKPEDYKKEDIEFEYVDK